MMANMIDLYEENRVIVCGNCGCLTEMTVDQSVEVTLEQVFGESDHVFLKCKTCKAKVYIHNGNGTTGFISEVVDVH